MNLAQILAWSRNKPDVPGYWLSGYWDHGRFFIDHWNIAGTLNLPVKENPDWWWYGPIRFPKKY